MSRSGGFAAGVALGGLGGLVLGYLLSRNGHHGGVGESTASIDLTPSIELTDVPARARARAVPPAPGDSEAKPE
jgi:hypothetical protein